MLNILFAAISYTSYLVLAFFQSPANLPDLNKWIDVGMGTAFIGAFFWLFRYFTTYIKEREQLHREQLAEKDAQIREMTGEVLKITKENIIVQAGTTETNRQVLTLLQSLNQKI